MKKKTLILLAGFFFAALMTLNFYQGQNASTSSSITVKGLNAAQAQDEPCPCSAQNCVCGKRIQVCPSGGTKCTGTGSECGSSTSCMG